MALRRRRACADRLVPIGRVVAVVAYLVAGAAPAVAVDADSTCRAVLEAFSTLESEALRGVLAQRDVQLTLPASDDGRHAATDGRFSGDQAIVMLRTRLQREDPPSAPPLGPDAMVSEDGTLACLCPTIDEGDGTTFLVLYFGTDRGDASGRGRGGRLYLDLRHDPARDRWAVVAVRGLR